MEKMKCIECNGEGVVERSRIVCSKWTCCGACDETWTEDCKECNGTGDYTIDPDDVAEMQESLNEFKKQFGYTPSVTPEELYYLFNYC
jgi:DnaJ-class molecular chaperone